MRVLALADKRPPVDPAEMAQQMRVDAVFCLGDLDRAWIESLMGLSVPVYGVHGNHDPEHALRDLEIEDMHLRRTQVAGGLTVAGFEGCVEYHRGAVHQYTQKEGCKLARKLPAADVLLCHCPPLGINDDPEDPAHIGFQGLREWVDEHHPRYVLHGHTHPIAGRTVKLYRETQVHWIHGARALELR